MFCYHISTKKTRIRSRDMSLSNILNQTQVDSLNCSHVPAAWKRGITVPILKSGKDPHSMKSLRPITMLSCMGKLLERIIQKRIEHYIESNAILNIYQMGFRRGHSTTEALSLIYQDINESLENKKFCITVYLLSLIHI